MTDKELMQQALEALEGFIPYLPMRRTIMRNEKLGRYVEEPVAEYQEPKSIPYQIELFEKNLNRLQEIVVQL